MGNPDRKFADLVAEETDFTPVTVVIGRIGSFRAITSGGRQHVVVNQTGTFEIEGRYGTLAEDEYADALLRYWAAVKEAEQTIAPFFRQGAELSPEQRRVIADVVAHVAQAEDVYFAALEAAGEPLPNATQRAEGS
jgi:hypothetical protein